MPGPKPIPTLKLQSRGSWRGRVRQDEIKPSTEISGCPEWLDDEAKKKWFELMPKLQSLGLLTNLDIDALARYCDTWSWWRKCRIFIEKNGETFKTSGSSGDYHNQYPHVAIIHKLAAELDKLEKSFGLTPADRVGLKAGSPKEEDNNKMRFFKQS